MVQELLRKRTQMIFLPGNRHEFARLVDDNYLGLNFGGVEVMAEHLHLTADGCG